MNKILPLILGILWITVAIFAWDLWQDHRTGQATGPAALVVIKEEDPVAYAGIMNAQRYRIAIVLGLLLVLHPINRRLQRGTA
jgi:uncharacterized iron-regulated membrane protein